MIDSFYPFPPLVGQTLSGTGLAVVTTRKRNSAMRALSFLSFLFYLPSAVPPERPSVCVPLRRARLDPHQRGNCQLCDQGWHKGDITHSGSRPPP